MLSHFDKLINSLYEWLQEPLSPVRFWRFNSLTWRLRYKIGPRRLFTVFTHYPVAGFIRYMNRESGFCIDLGHKANTL